MEKRAPEKGVLHRPERPILEQGGAMAFEIGTRFMVLPGSYATQFLIQFDRQVSLTEIESSERLKATLLGIWSAYDPNISPKDAPTRKASLASFRCPGPGDYWEVTYRLTKGRVNAPSR